MSDLQDTVRLAPLRFAVPGRVVPWKRTRGSGADRYTDPDHKAYRDQIGWQAKHATLGRGQIPFGDIPVAVSIAAVMDRPDRADVDNIAKVTLDALQEIVFDDDRQVARLLAVRLPAGGGDEVLQVEVRRHDPDRPWP